MSCPVCVAIMSSSLVGMVHVETCEFAAEMRGPPAVFAAASTFTPTQAALPHTRSRMTTEFSPIPPVKTIASNPPKAAASEPSSRPMR